MALTLHPSPTQTYNKQKVKTTPRGGKNWPGTSGGGSTDETRKRDLVRRRKRRRQLESGGGGRGGEVDTQMSVQQVTAAVVAAVRSWRLVLEAWTI